MEWWVYLVIGLGILFALIALCVVVIVVYRISIMCIIKKLDEPKVHNDNTAELSEQEEAPKSTVIQ
jgi:hypothetical protein